MYEIIKDLNETTKLAIQGERIYTLKKMYPQEIQLYKEIKSISNAHLAKIVDFASIENDLYAVSLYIQGETLKSYVTRNGGMSDNEVIDIASQLCDGLRALHERGIIHRDINPNNIIITDSKTAVIIDYGISRFKKILQNRDTQILGTQGYAAPEQFGFEQTSGRSDIYSLGVVINYMKTGFLPNEKMCGGYFEPIVKRCTEIDAINRYPDIEELYNAINKIKSNKFKAFLRKMPGFKSGKWYFQLPAAIYYTTLLALIISNISQCIEEQKSVLYTIVDSLIMPLTLLAPILIAFNANNWIDKMPFTKNATKSKRITVSVLLAIAAFIAGALLINTENIIP